MIRTVILSLLFIQYSYAISEYDDLFHDFDKTIKEIVPLSDLPNAELQILRKDLKIQSLIFEALMEVHLEGGEITNMDLVSQNLQRSIILAENARAVQVGDRLKTDMIDLLKTTVNPNRLKDKIQKVLNFVKQDLKHKGTNIAAYTRRFGAQVGIFYLAMMQIDYTLPLILMANGHYEIGATLFALPISSTTTAGFAAIRSAVKYRHILKKLGLKESLQHYNIFKKVKNFIDKNFLITNYLVDINMPNHQILFNIQESNAVVKLFTKLGYKKYITYDSLVNFLEEKRLYRGFTRRLKQTNKSELSKVLLILQKIERSEDLTLIFEIRKRFGKRVNLVKGIPNVGPLIKWAFNVAHAKDMHSLFSELRKNPVNLPPRLFDKVWRKYIIPHLTRSFGNYLSYGNYKSFRRLSEIYSKEIRPEILKRYSTDTHLSKTLIRRLQNYVYEAFVPAGSCEIPFRLKQFKEAPIL